MSNPITLDESKYGQVGWFHVAEVERLFSALEAEGVRFFFETPDSGLSGVDPVTASYGGSFGQSAQVLVYVHLEDQSKFDNAFKRVFGSAETKVDWKKRLRGG